MNSITLVYPYYRNPRTLRDQISNWNSFAFHEALLTEVILVDDASPEPAEPIFKECRLPKKLFRVREDKPWNQHAARNIGACEAPDGWMLMTDMDVEVPDFTIGEIATANLDPDLHYTFRRVFRNGQPEKVHCNSFLVTKKKFWEAGGYDERFCGTYGGDGVFLRALERVAPREHRDDFLVYGYNGVIEDCSTRDWGRKDTDFHREYIRRRDEFHGQPPLTMTCKYDRVF